MIPRKDAPGRVHEFIRLTSYLIRKRVTNGHELVVLYLITSKISLPVGFEFYQPDPELVEWKKHDEVLKKQGIKKSERPAKPA